MLHFEDIGQVTSPQGQNLLCLSMYVSEHRKHIQGQQRHPLLKHALLSAPCPLALLHYGNFRQKNKTVPSCQWSQHP